MKSIKYKKIILICDYGLDDAAATSYILEHYDYFDSIDIIPIAGNMPIDVSFKNAMRILNSLDFLPTNVRLIDSSSIPQFEENLTDIHGNDGIGDFLPKKIHSLINAIDFDVWLKTVSEDYLIISLGPCTVPERILQHIDLPLLIMGGNISETPNYNGYEFNQGMDIQAFESCVKHQHIIATLDSCHNPYCDFYKIDINNNKLSSCFIRRSVELSRARNEKSAYIYDLITVMYLFKPEKFVIRQCLDKDGNNLSVLDYSDASLLM